MFVTAGCFLVPLAAYLWTASRTVQGGDAGEFGCIGLLGGVAHPPGYPLYSVLARLAGHLPLTSQFLRVSALSALCGAATVAVIQRAAWRFSSSLGGSVAGALVFAFAPLQWRLSGIPEVFTLNALAAALILLLAFRITQEGATRRRDLLLLGLTCGLGLSNHLTIVLCTPLVAWALLRSDGISFATRAALFLGGVLAGLLPYALLPLFALTAPVEASVWGQTASVHGFLQHVLRRDYGTFRLSPTGDRTLFHLAPVGSFMEALPFQYAFVPFALGLLGLVMARRLRGTGALLLSFGLAGIGFISLFNLNLPRFVSLAIEERFHLLPMLLLVPFLAVGLASALDRLPMSGQAAAIGALMAALFAAHYGLANWKRETVTQDYVAGALQELEPDAVLVGSTDTWFSAVRWMTRVEGVRPDVHYVDVNLARLPWSADRLAQEIPRFPRAAASKPPWKLVLSLASTNHPTYVLSWDGLDRSQITTEPVGFVDHVVKPGTPPRPLAEQEQSLTRTTAALKPFTGAPVDVHSALVRRQAAFRWAELAERFAKAGDASGDARCRATAAALYPD